jgi:ribosomal protein S18 acetylase RimI-like enzyme
MCIRQMKEDDIENVSGLLCSCYRWLADIEKYDQTELNFLLTKRGSIESIRRESAIEKYYVATADEVIVGMVSIRDNNITKLYVHPEHHGKGIGKELFATAKNEITKSGFRELNAVAIGESAVPFYENMGMHINDRTKSRAKGFENRVGIIMRMQFSKI